MGQMGLNQVEEKWVEEKEFELKTASRNLWLKLNMNLLFWYWQIEAHVRAQVYLIKAHLEFWE